MKFRRICIELIINRQLTPWGRQVAGGPIVLEALGASLHSLLVNPALLCCLGFSEVISLEV